MIASEAEIVAVVTETLEAAAALVEERGRYVAEP